MTHEQQIVSEKLRHMRHAGLLGWISTPGLLADLDAAYCLDAQEWLPTGRTYSVGNIPTLGLVRRTGN